MRVCVVGGGAAGLSAAIHAAPGAAVTLLEKNDRCGVKLLTTGGGHCNATNTRPIGEWPALFGHRGRFIVPALERMNGERLADWFAGLGQPLVCRDGFHCFPASRSARAVRDALAAEAARLGVRTLFSRRVAAIEPGRNSPGLAVVTEDGNESYDKVILACGGVSWPATGSTGDGARIARALGHRLIPPVPGLVGLRTDDLDAELSGLVLPGAMVSYSEKGRGRIAGAGELLLTHAGVSGPAILDLSASVNEALAAGGRAVLHINWIAGRDQKWWLARLALWRVQSGATPLPSLLREFLPARLARWLCRKADAATTAANLPASARDKLADALSAFPLRITDHEGWDKAMITRGGVDVRDVDPKTLESRVTPGLFFAGETLDVDGPCGGYNLHWAFASGALAGRMGG